MRPDGDGGQLWWMWVFSTSQVSVYAIPPGRGFEQAAMVSGADFAGFLVRDGWSVYRQFLQALHQTCLAHLAPTLPGDDLGVGNGETVFPRTVQAILQDALQLRDRREEGQISERGVAVARAGSTISTGIIAVYVLSGSNTIKSNKIDAGGATGMILSYDATNSVVQGNAIANSSTAISGCDVYGSSFSSGFTVTGNTITDATVGMQMPDPNDNITTPNNYYATATAVAPHPCF
ncbi:MAG TPA: transposase [Candidatus Sulfotelmatobacter sp.]